MSDTPDFESIKQTDSYGVEHWSARDLAPLLGYSQWRRFEDTIQRAIISCAQSGNIAKDHFASAGKMIETGKGATREVVDYALSRLACYLVAQNGDPRKPEIAAAQLYFAVQTRRQQLADELATLPEKQRRLRLRKDIKGLNRHLQDTAKNAGVVKPQEFSAFQDHGYQGLYGGLRENDIHARKKLKPKEKILDYMGSEELGANIFRVTQTEAKIRRENLQKKEEANEAHYAMGKRVRQFIKDGEGTMPEDLPTPEKSIRQLQKEQEREEQKRIQRQYQQTLPSFDKIEEV